jgi:hypothetical protein
MDLVKDSAIVCTADNGIAIRDPKAVKDTGEAP